MNDYLLGGWRINSQLPLPELLPWTGDDRPPDIEISLGSVPDRLEGGISVGPLVDVRSGDNTCQLKVENVARFLVSGGCRVMIEPNEPRDDASVRVFLLGTALAMLCCQRGLIPLHASCVRIGDSAVALAGISGAGKSTLAAALVQQGAGLVADDVCIVDVAARSGPLVRPAIPRLKLWRNSIDGLQMPSEGIEPVRRNIEKYSVRADASFTADPLPLAAVYHLQESFGEVSDLRRLSGLEALTALMGNIYRPRIWMAMTQKIAITEAAMKILSSVPVYGLSTQRQFGAAARRADELTRRHRNGCR